MTRSWWGRRAAEVPHGIVVVSDRWSVGGRPGVSAAPYDALNLADHVGDDPAAVQANRTALSEAIGAPLVLMAPVHGRDVAVVDASRSGTAISGVDGLVTTDPTVAVVAMGADCAPVAFVAPGVVGVAHAGWKGVRDGIVPAVIAAMVDLGARRADIEVTIGPAICAQHYPVDHPRWLDATAAVHAMGAATSSGDRALDLVAGIRAQLVEAGVTAAVAAAACTAESPDHFSYRRDGVTGRQAVAARVNPATG